MKEEKCIVFDFSKGKKRNTAYYHYHNGQLDLDLEIEEVRTPSAGYYSNIISFKKKKKNSSSLEVQEEPSNTA